MTRPILPILAALLAMPVLSTVAPREAAAQAQAQSTFSEDEIAVRRAVEDYFRGIEAADHERLGRALHLEGGHMKFVGPKDRNNRDAGQALHTQTLTEFRAGIRPENPDPVSGTILSMDIVDGKMAWVKFRFELPDILFTDYLMFYKIDGTWKLVNKMFTAVRKQTTAATN